MVSEAAVAALNWQLHHVHHMCRSLCTNTYQLNFLELPSGIKIILNTSPGTSNMQELLRSFYLEVFVSLCVKDCTYLPGQKVTNPGFDEEVDAFFKRHSLV